MLITDGPKSRILPARLNPRFHTHWRWGAETLPFPLCFLCFSPKLVELLCILPKTQTEDPPHPKGASPETPVLSRKVGGPLLPMGNSTVPYLVHKLPSHPSHFLAAGQKTNGPACFPHLQNVSFLNHGEDSGSAHRYRTHHLVWHLV